MENKENVNLDTDTKNKIVDLFMNEGDKKALEILYEATKDEIVKILIKWKKEYKEFIDEGITYAVSMYEDIMSYIWKKYKLDKGDVENGNSNN